MLVFLLLVIPLVSTAAHRQCEYNCSCSNDDACKFYCSDGHCQYSIPPFGACQGYQVHPRECGKYQWCNPATKQCERGKAEYYSCQYDYECISSHCKKGLCRRESGANAAIVVLSIVSAVLFLATIIIVIRYKRRIAALQRRLAATTIITGESKPPPYGAVPVHRP